MTWSELAETVREQKALHDAAWPETSGLRFLHILTIDLATVTGELTETAAEHVSWLRDHAETLADVVSGFVGSVPSVVVFLDVPGTCVSGIVALADEEVEWMHLTTGTRATPYVESIGSDDAEARLHHRMAACAGEDPWYPDGYDASGGKGDPMKIVFSDDGTPTVTAWED